MNDTPSRLPLTRLSLILLILALALIWFGPLGYRHLVPSDEGRYAEMAREMFVTGDWITPRYNGYKYFEKPPLQTWANALTFAWFGIGDWRARLYTALTGFVGVLLVGYTGTRVFNAMTGFAAAVILATCPYWNLMGHFNTLDMGLSLWMELTLCALLLAQRPGLPVREVRLWMWLCWAGMAAALLSKGLIGLILPGAILILYSLVSRDWALWKRLYIGSGLIMFLIIVAPWFALVQIKNPEFFDFFFIVQQFKRYLMPEQNRPGTFYYFVPVLIVGFLPWLSIAVQSVRHGMKTPRQPNGFAPVTMLLVWSAFIFLFFSASHSKLISYVLPVAPALALVIGLYLPSLTKALYRVHLIGYAVFLIVAALGAIFIGRAGSANNPNALYREFQIWVWAGLAVAFAVTLFALWLNRRSVLAGAAGLGAAWLLLGTIAGSGHDVFGTESSGVKLVPAVKAAMAKLPPDTPFYSIAKLDHTMPFYLGHTMILVQEADELTFGVRTEPQKWVPSIDDWIKLWDSERYGLALMPPLRYDELAARHVPMQVIARDARRVIVEKPQP
ncbi:Polymyxin resistance protein ArnT,undecaprenylphosphate-alpha-L-Ara4N transferase, Melittin resistanceprotein PqaB [Candidatus Paraburkholderia kirkii UZHbot1]|uniref:Polymyxin resistance protein ArnT,undecaprenylphosphate-alpha-L-Ara4N transferase, Melittin resistanceprotein PqaB n=1 Tax=Candidatus Paraburkholderia kirkii UZHbot1 TaxID=1055526 RepID=G4MDJ0_9BURK|nr:Polymyxin resistance protein ArnT,undecaprenylphosphate-alpha-L-Ara4N transferase, Melittin resistanceprotein PqaB [Candidatus Paraburkholderia kirkii UZHbot1]